MSLVHRNIIAVIAAGWLSVSVGCLADKPCSQRLADDVPPTASEISPVALADENDGGAGRGAGLLPRGSAVLTSSGALAAGGITAIIHAASGGRDTDDPLLIPTIIGVRESVRNAVVLAERHGHARVAFPLIGGGVFLEILGVDQLTLANVIVASAVDARRKIDLVFTGFAAEAGAFRAAITAQELDASPFVRVIEGSITDGRLHGASAIVNAANTAVSFGGGLSKIIGEASERKDAIDLEAAAIVRRALGRDRNR